MFIISHLLIFIFNLPWVRYISLLCPCPLHTTPTLCPLQSMVFPGELECTCRFLHVCPTSLNEITSSHVVSLFPPPPLSWSILLPSELACKCQNKPPWVKKPPSSPPLHTTTTPLLHGLCSCLMSWIADVMSHSPCVMASSLPTPTTTLLSLLSTVRLTQLAKITMLRPTSSLN